VERFQGRPFALVGVNTDNDPKAVLELQNQGKVTWRSLCRGADRAAAAYGLHVLPTVVVIDHKGVVQFVSSGTPNADDLDRKLGELVADAEVGR
jgi:hypothetical protein